MKTRGRPFSDPIKDLDSHDEPTVTTRQAADGELWLRFLWSFALSGHLVDASEALREYAKQAGLPMPPVDEDDPKSAWIAWIKSRGVRSGIYGDD